MDVQRETKMTEEKCFCNGALTDSGVNCEKGSKDYCIKCRKKARFDSIGREDTQGLIDKSLLLD